MKTLRENATDYLAVRRTMGFKVEGLSKLLCSFVAFCEERGATRVQNDLAVQWATTRIKVPVSDALVSRRLDAVRIFARYQHALDPATQIPDEVICRRRYQPKSPNVFSEAEILALIAAADTLSPPFKALTWRTLIGLLAATGMRPGEACRLSINDIDVANGVIQILQTKFGKSRLVFIHPSTASVVAHYLQARQDWVGTAARTCQAVFVNSRRGPLNPDKLGVTFKRIVAAAGLDTGPGRRPARLHDLRHTFAVTTMIDWYRDGQDVQVRLPLLSTWLGHVDPASTYWYLHAVPELLAHAANRIEYQTGSPTRESAS
ncbi:tyrosine-type recombinase/integrase [[Mycobacterium] vasticus]|uniref:Tyrosine-type recombinase/integrase n=1 Tax=[Mycobacterium] vasticus TaxID=2875777 RepID=A0ABU5Z3V9_9MYCO|nr:tyrosine-type recombinase/integrase [Mycolicibacter sp. MYC017]MEB3072086.1 tyrosine-type recombinase/integrase [Mycolicibacter sp. MYC017]